MLDVATAERTKIISRGRLIIQLARIRHPTIVTLYAETVPDMVVKHRETKELNPYLGRLRKQAKVNGMLCFDYSRSVNLQRIRESNAQTVDEVNAVPEFTPASRSWGHRMRPRPWQAGDRVTEVPDTCFVEYRNWLYVEIKVERRLGVRYTVDRVPIEDNAIVRDVAQYFYKRSESQRQGLKKPVVLRDYGIETILGVQFDGTLWKVDRDT